jgi:hypothetical protein
MTTFMSGIENSVSAAHSLAAWLAALAANVNTNNVRFRIVVSPEKTRKALSSDALYASFIDSSVP